MSIDTLDAQIAQAVKTIEAGGVVILPADSVYGIYGNAQDEKTINRAFDIKGRMRSKPFGIATNAERVGEVGLVSPDTQKLIDRIWPAAISFIVPKNPVGIPAFFSGDEPGILVVCGNNPILAGIIERCSCSLFSTTCNFAGEDEARSIEDLEPFRPKVDFIIENTLFEFVGTPSSIVNTMGESLSIIREGAVSRAQIEAQIGEIQIKPDELIQ